VAGPLLRRTGEVGQFHFFSLPARPLPLAVASFFFSDNPYSPCRQPFFRLPAGLFLLFGRAVVRKLEQLTLLTPEFNMTFLTTILPAGKSALYGDFRTL
jgi:hypothetical protein